MAEGSHRIDLGLIGIGGGRVETVPFDGLCAVVHACPSEPYRSERPDEVEKWVVTHQKVVETAWRRFGTVLPAGFDTIFADEDVARWLEKEQASLREKLSRVKGRAEYGVQILREPVAEAPATHVEEESRGTAYLLRRKEDRARRTRIEEEADADLRRIRIVAPEIRINRPLGERMLLNVAILLDSAAVPKLGEVLDAIAARPGMSIRFTGPWPPYNFA